MAKFLRKRDPRFQKHQRELAEIAKQNEANSKAKLADAKARSAAAADTYIEQDWQKIDPTKQHHHADLEWGIAEGGDNDEEWECVACGKSFRSEAAWDSHERSKKHLKAIEKLRREMEQDDEDFELQEGVADEEEVDEGAVVQVCLRISTAWQLGCNADLRTSHVRARARVWRPIFKMTDYGNRLSLCVSRGHGGVI